jgi:hypothetical protein
LLRKSLPDQRVAGSNPAPQPNLPLQTASRS